MDYRCQSRKGAEPRASFEAYHHQWSQLPACLVLPPIMSFLPNDRCRVMTLNNTNLLDGNIQSYDESSRSSKSPISIPIFHFKPPTLSLCASLFLALLLTYMLSPSLSLPIPFLPPNLLPGTMLYDDGIVEKNVEKRRIMLLWSSLSPSTLREGQRATCKFATEDDDDSSSTADYYPGKIGEINGSTFTFLFDDGDVSSGVEVSSLKDWALPEGFGVRKVVSSDSPSSRNQSDNVKTPTTPKVKVGMKGECLFEDGNYYSGEVKEKIRDGTVLFFFDDGDMNEHAKLSDLRNLHFPVTTPTSRKSTPRGATSSASSASKTSPKSSPKSSPRSVGSSDSPSPPRPQSPKPRPK